MTNDIRTLLERLRRALDRLDIDLDELVVLLVGHFTSTGPAGQSAGDAPDDDETRVQRLPRATKRLLRRLARPGTARFSLVWREDGRAVVRLADSDPFVLARKLALVLEIIAAGRLTETKTDRFVAFRTNDEIARELQSRTGEAAPITSHAVTQLISRLRDALLAHDVNPDLVETRKYRGVRLRYRRRGKEPS